MSPSIHLQDQAARAEGDIGAVEEAQISEEEEESYYVEVYSNQSEVDN